MPRAQNTALSRRSIAAAALDMMDRDGYAAFSMPKLGELLGVRTPSLYHHFRDRDELEAMVAHLVIAETPTTTLELAGDWTDSYVSLAIGTRRTILRHPNTAPVLLRHLPREVMTPAYEAAAVRLGTVKGLRLEQHELVLDALEKFTIGSSLIEATSLSEGGANAFRDVDAEKYPRLADAAAANTMDAEQMFVAALQALLRGMFSKGKQRRRR